MTKTKSNNFLMLAIIAIVAVVAIAFFMKPKEPTASEKAGNAVEQLGDDIDDAADELRPARTPAEKMGDAVEDAGDDIEDATD